MTSNQPWWLTMPPAELAATIVPLFSHNAKSHVWEGGALAAIATWCRTGSYCEPLGSPVGMSDFWFDNPDIRAVAEAIQVLDHAGLLLRSFHNQGGSFVGLTRLGMHALQTNTVRQHLGLSEAPPTHL